MDFAPWGILYIVRCKDLFKIGQTKGPMEERLRMLQAGNPYKLQLICTIPVVDPVGTEREIHKMFDHCRVRGEWFRLTQKDIESFRTEERIARKEYARWKAEINYQV